MVEMERFYYEKNIKEKNKGNEILELLQEKYELNSAQDLSFALKDLFKDALQQMMNAEFDTTTGYSKYDKTTEKSNYRNGSTKKTLKSQFGEFEFETPRDRNGEFEPKIVPKNKRDVSGIEDKGYSKYLSDTLFCNDRSLASGDGFSLDDTTIYGAYNRNVNNKAPSLKCPRQVDQFTTNKSENIGNGELTYSVGLITIDEVAMAGGKSANDNDLNWLTSGQDFWGASPSQFKSWATDASVWSVDYVGSLDHFWSTASWHGVRPVINLRKDTLISEGNGTKTNPYVIASNQNIKNREDYLIKIFSISAIY